MDDGPSHYRGLVAESYDLWFGDDPHEDHPFYRRLLEDDGEPGLEVACGTGRLLLPYLRDGLEVEGVDASAEMLAICRRKAAAMGLDPVLHEQRMEALDLPRRYRTVFVPYGSFQVLVEPADVEAALARFHAHLEPGGTLALALFVPREDLDPLPRWRLRREGVRPDGAVVLMHEAVDYDVGQRVRTDWYRYEVVEDGVVVRAEMRKMRHRWFGEREFRLLLERAGFDAIRTWGDYLDEPFSERHGELVVTARRPSG